MKKGREGEREREREKEGVRERFFPRALMTCIPSDSHWDSRLDRYRVGHSWALSSEDDHTIITLSPNHTNYTGAYPPNRGWFIAGIEGD